MTSVDEFLREAREFLDGAAKRREAAAHEWGVGPDEIDVIQESSAEDERRNLEEARAWRRRVYDRGFGWPSGPKRFGGRELPHEFDALYRKLENEYDVPDQGDLVGGLTIIGPSIMAYGSEAAKVKYLSRLYRAEIVACQLFSEPGAGSDLAALSTRAIPDGDSWLISGQKVWTSGAQVSDVAEIFVRTSLDQPRHRGISVFLLDMSSPGITVRPIRQMTGGAHFNEVFLDSVVVSDSMRLGPVNGGWSVIIETLRSERASLGLGTGTRNMDPFRRLWQLAAHEHATARPLVRQKLADVAIRNRVLDLTARRIGELNELGLLVGPEAAMTKLMFSSNYRRMGDLAAEILGPSITADTSSWGTYAWSRFVLGAPALRIAGGTDEIMRNTIAEQVLGLPREPRVTP